MSYNIDLAAWTGKQTRVPMMMSSMQPITWSNLASSALALESKCSISDGLPCRSGQRWRPTYLLATTMSSSSKPRSWTLAFKRRCPNIGHICGQLRLAVQTDWSLPALLILSGRSGDPKNLCVLKSQGIYNFQQLSFTKIFQLKQDLELQRLIIIHGILALLATHTVRKEFKRIFSRFHFKHSCFLWSYKVFFLRFLSLFYYVHVQLICKASQ